jgi:2-dehydropantoate 2-reductase
VLDKGLGITYVGQPRSETGAAAASDTLAAFVDVLTTAGLRAELTDDIEGQLWAKLAMASGINPVAVVIRLTNGDIGSVPTARALSHALISEVSAVAAAQGISLAFDPLEAFDQVTAATAAMVSGSLIDSLRGKRTEIGSICGAVAIRARDIGVAAPICESFGSIVRALESSYDRRVHTVEAS